MQTICLVINLTAINLNNCLSKEEFWNNHARGNNSPNSSLQLPNLRLLRTLLYIASLKRSLFALSIFILNYRTYPNNIIFAVTRGPNLCNELTLIGTKRTISKRIKLIIRERFYCCPPHVSGHFGTFSFDKGILLFGRSNSDAGSSFGSLRDQPPSTAALSTLAR